MWNALEYMGYALGIRENVENIQMERDRYYGQDGKEKEAGTVDYYYYLLDSGIKMLERKKEITIVIKKDVWEEFNKEVSTNIEKWAIEVNNENIYVYTTTAFSVLINSILLKNTRDTKIELPERWYRECKPNEDGIERIGLICFQYVMGMLDK